MTRFSGIWNIHYFSQQLTDVFLFEFTSQVSFDKSCFTSTTITDKDKLQKNKSLHAVIGRVGASIIDYIIILYIIYASINVLNRAHSLETLAKELTLKVATGSACAAITIKVTWIRHSEVFAA